MSNMLTYMEWRGDLSFQASKFNEVDNLIFSQMCYAPLDGVVDEAKQNEDGSFELEKLIGNDKKSRIDHVGDRYFNRCRGKQLSQMESQQVRASMVLERMAQTKRFRECELHYYVAKTDLVMEKQFAAVTIDLKTDALYIAFRGTDNTLVGWKEDFSMCFNSHISAQRDALAYFEEIAKKNPDKKYFLGGHSKGGNLAAYAAIMCKPEYKERIVRVYNNDGPGFRKDIVQSEQYKAILHKIRTIVPESSIVGMLLEHEEDYTVVRSSQSGSMQHDAMSWEVLGRHFIYLEKTSKGSKRIDSIITAWLSDLSKEQMRAVVDVMFSVLTEAGFSTVSSIQKEPLKNIAVLLKQINQLDAEDKRYIMSAVTALVKEGNRTMRNEIPNPFETEEDN